MSQNEPMTSQNMQQLLDEYSQSHRNKTNKQIHYICVPAIFWAISAMLWVVTIPYFLNLAIVMVVLLTVYYLSKDFIIAIEMLVFSGFCLGLNYFLLKTGVALFVVAVVVFVVAWVFQFIGHKIEGKKPSFFKDLQFLLIGPAWIVQQLFKPKN